jgi:LSD1 subclass zinc finger protein
MRVRCGACRTEFDVPGAGRFACPVCGSVNVVRDTSEQPPPDIGGYPAAPGAPVEGVGAPPPPPPPPEPSVSRIECPECGFSFLVGEIAVATCPMCSAEVPTGLVEEDSEE